MIKKPETLEQLFEIIEDADEKKEEANQDVDRALRLLGWEYTSSTPGSIWLWKKTINDVTYIVSRSTAIDFEKSLLPSEFTECEEV